jgi:hypothetical protein
MEERQKGLLDNVLGCLRAAGEPVDGSVHLRSIA